MGKKKWFTLCKVVCTERSEVKGFTLVEVLIVITVLALMTVGTVGFFDNSLMGSRDGRRKADLSTIQKGLESYYNDYGYYPVDISASSLCGSTANCYVKTIPTDPKGYAYLYVSGNESGTNQSFQLYSTLERNIDASAANDDSGTGTGTYSGNCGVAGAGCKYGVSSTNTTP